MRKKLSGDERKKIIEKIQKLFNRAECTVVDADDDESVDHEAQLALETARRLMLQYGLEAHDVETVSAGKPGSSGEGFVVNLGISHTGEWVKTLAITIADYFCVKVLYTPEGDSGKASYLFFGIAIGSQAAAYAFQSCFNQIRTLSRRYVFDREKWETHPLQHMFRTWEKYRDIAKEEYRKGLVIGFYEHLSKIQAEESKEVTALAVAYEKVAEDWIEDKPFNVKKERPKDAKLSTADGHFSNGYNDSDKVQMVRGMAGDVEDVTDKDKNKNNSAVSSH